MSDVIGRGVIEVSGDSSKLNAAIAEARRSIATLGDAQKSASDKAGASIDRYITRLETQNKTIAMSARETDLYKLALRGATDEQLRAANAALKFSESHKRNADQIAGLKTAFLTIGAVAATGLIAAYVAFDDLVKKAGDFQDIAEKTGASAEGFASLAVSAQIGGVAINDLSTMANKLSKNLTGIDDESAAAGAALKTLGLSIEDIRSQDPTQRFVSIAKALEQFADGPAKAAIAIDLMGKAGADSLPFLKELASGVGQVNILTAEQIRMADDYADKQKKTSAMISAYAQAVSTELLPSINDFKLAAVDLGKGLVGIEDGIKGLGKGNEIQEFADNAALAIAFVADAVDGLIRMIKVAGMGIAGISAFMVSPISQSKAILSAMMADIENTLTRPQLSQLLEGRIAARQQKSSAPKIVDPFDPDAGGWQIKPTLDYKGAQKDRSSEIASEAKAQRDLEVEQIRKQSSELINVYANAQRIMEAQRAATLIDEKTYYAAKSGFILLNEQEQEHALLAEIERLQKSSFTGKDKLENDKKIVEAQAKLAKVRSDASANMTINSIQEEAAMRKIAATYTNATLAAEAYLDTIRRQNAAQVEGLGKGTRSREIDTGKAAIENKFIDRSRELDADLRRNQITQEDYNLYLEIARYTYNEEVNLYEKKNQAILDKQADWTVGAKEAFANYADEARNVAKITETAFANVFSSLEDSLVNFVKTGKFDFKSLADTMIAELARVQIKAAMAPVTAGIGNWISSLFNSSSSSSVIPMQAGGGYHSGGIVGSEPTFSRSVPSSVFFGARKYHSGGIVGDEVPAILKPGEGVFTPGQMKALGAAGDGSAMNVSVNQTIHIDSRSDKGTILQAMMSAKEMAKSEILDSLRRGGAFARA